MNNLYLFLISSLLLILTPGPDMIYVISSSVQSGRKAGLISAIGVSTGLFTHALIASLGLGSIISNYPSLITIIKTIGSIYFIYLGIKSFITKGKKSNHDNNYYLTNNFYVKGLLSNILNPKIIIFFIAFLPQFVNIDSDYYNLKLLVHGLIFSLLTILVYSIITFVAGTTHKKLNHSNLASIIPGLLLLFLGLYILVKIYLVN